MIRIAIVFYTQSGVTGKLAKAIEEGAGSVEGVEIISCDINSKEIIEGRYRNTELLDSLTKCDAIIFGSPTFMGGGCFAI